MTSPREREGAPAPSEDRHDRTMRFARLIIMVTMGMVAMMLGGIPLFEVVFSGPSDDPWRPLAALGTSLPLTVLVLLLMRDRIDGRRVPDPLLYWGSLALLAATSVLLRDAMLTMGLYASWWSVGVFAAPRRWGVPVTLVLLAAPWAIYLTERPDLPFASHLLFWAGAILWALLMASGSMATIWLWDITRQAVEGQSARARLAVTEERLRFARDMHDLLGHSLSALAVKAELAGRLVDRAPERAEKELREVHGLAQEALGQVRAAVDGYREPDLAEEVASVRGVLETAGVRVEVTGLEDLECAEVPAGATAPIAWAVREGGTNVLRHSDATRCRIDFSLVGGEGGRALVVEMSNDGARDGDGGRGNGLSGLSERLSAAGGGLTAARTREGGFLLRAVLPL
ncbi:sensor histidine kinase [Nocardiopsis sp. NPDC057823]|uniref:sensor histidine kinase n=1 Tax=Nocardiopsis sp. NPDC057823 TaxID=3346256 RepID=UPI00367136CE